MLLLHGVSYSRLRLHRSTQSHCGGQGFKSPRLHQFPAQLSLGSIPTNSIPRGASSRASYRSSAAPGIELCRLPRISSAWDTMRATIVAAGGMSWISATASPAITAAMSKFPAALAAPYSATASTFCMSSNSRPRQRRTWSLTRQRPVKGRGQTLFREMSKIRPRMVSPPLAAQIRRLASSGPSASMLA